MYEHGWSGLHRSGPDLFERRRSNGPSGPYTTLRGEEIIYSRAVERKDYCGMASEPDLPIIADGGVERAATISTLPANKIIGYFCLLIFCWWKRVARASFVPTTRLTDNDSPLTEQITQIQRWSDINNTTVYNRITAYPVDCAKM